MVNKTLKCDHNKRLITLTSNYINRLLLQFDINLSYVDSGNSKLFMYSFLKRNFVERIRLRFSESFIKNAKRCAQFLCARENVLRF